jgi:lipocalin
MKMQAVLSLALAGAATHAASAVPSLWDGQCFYPTADSGFQLDSYLGRWYQVAGTLAPFTAGCKCIFAQYALNVSSPPSSPDCNVARGIVRLSSVSV